MNFLTKNAPPGANILIHTNWYIAGLSWSLLWSLGFLFRYFDTYNQLLYTRNGIRYQYRYQMMADYDELLGGSMRGIYIIILLLGVSVFLNYASFYQGSRSIYLMKRLPNRWELHRRCIFLPVLGMAGALAIRITVLLFYFAVYMLVTPDRCLPPDQWQKLWSVLL